MGLNLIFNQINSDHCNTYIKTKVENLFMIYQALYMNEKYSNDDLYNKVNKYFTIFDTTLLADSKVSNSTVDEIFSRVMADIKQDYAFYLNNLSF